MDGIVMTPVGIDLSLTSSGISSGSVLCAITPKERGVARLRYIKDHVATIIGDIDRPIVLIEGYSFGSRNSQAHAIGELGGVVRLMLFDNEIPFIEIPPTTRAKFATGKGNASKNEVVSAVSARTGLTFSGKSADDLCDAWILEEIGRVHYSTPRFTWPSEHLKALEKVEWI